MTTPKRGDVLIRVIAGMSYELVDAGTREHIVVAPDLQVALRVASDHGGAVWRENVDGRRRPLGNPVLLLPRSSMPQI